MKTPIRMILTSMACVALGLIAMAVLRAQEEPGSQHLTPWRASDQAVRLPRVDPTEKTSATPSTEQQENAAWLTGLIGYSSDIARSSEPQELSIATTPFDESVRRLPPLLVQLELSTGQPLIENSSLNLPLPSSDLAPSMTPAFVPWWQSGVGNALRSSEPHLTVNPENLVVEALRHSPRIRAISDLSLIGETKIVEAQAEFDITAFMESKFIRNSEPVGSTLTTGGPPRLRDQNWSYLAGLRKKTNLGGSLELSQRVGTEESNSLFFLPPEQGNAKLSISFTQPLLNGAGRVYNQSLILLADIETGIAWDQSSKQLQTQLVHINETYWELYMQRALLLQRRRLLQRAEVILAELESRRSIDALESQIASAQAAVATRRAELIRADASIRNAETRIRALVNSPDLSVNKPSELIPFEAPAREYVEISTQEALIAAVKNRPEIDEALKQIHAANARVKMAKNELLPILDAVLETYVTGLEGNNDIGKAFGDQFSQGEPSFTAGLIVEIPLHNRAAKARYQRRKIELRQLTQQFQATLAMLSAEAEIAVREVNTSYREMQSNYTAMVAAEAELGYLEQRWRLLPGEDRSTSFLLEDLLSAQERIAAEEFSFSQSQVAYTVSLTKLKQATGTLLQYEQISAHQVSGSGLPQLYYDKPAPRPTPAIPSSPPPLSPSVDPPTADTNRYPLLAP